MTVLRELVSKGIGKIEDHMASVGFSRDLERFGWRVTGYNPDALIQIPNPNLENSGLPQPLAAFLSAELEFYEGNSFAISVRHPTENDPTRILALRVRRGRELVGQVVVYDSPQEIKVHFLTSSYLHSFKAIGALDNAYDLLYQNYFQPKPQAHLEMARHILTFSQKEFAKTPPWEPNPRLVSPADF